MYRSRDDSVSVLINLNFSVQWAPQTKFPSALLFSVEAELTETETTLLHNRNIQITMSGFTHIVCFMYHVTNHVCKHIL